MYSTAIYPQNISFPSMNSTPTSERPLPPLPGKRTDSTQAENPTTPSTPSTKGHSVDTKSPSLDALGEDNRLLKAELDYVLETQKRSEALLNDVEQAADRLRGAVLDFRRDLRDIEQAFLSSNEF